MPAGIAASYVATLPVVIAPDPPFTLKVSALVFAAHLAERFVVNDHDDVSQKLEPTTTALSAKDRLSAFVHPPKEYPVRANWFEGREKDESMFLSAIETIRPEPPLALNETVSGM